MDRILTPSGRLPERVYNEFTTNVDLNRPDGVIRSSDVDRYVENALKPLIEEGKAFKRITINRQTGIRTTRYSYQGGKNIQDSINAILSGVLENGTFKNGMLKALGYEIDPATGNVKGTDAPPPMTIANLGQHRYNVIKERILDPRTAASIKAQALRAGGVSTTNKASGYTTTIIRPGQSGEKNAMLKLVDEADKKYLAGLLPSSALADGSSPATVEERARAQVARQANIQDAKRDAIADYILRNPGSQLAKKMQAITDRETSARVRAAERDPRTKEFERKIFRSIRTNEARQRAVQKYIALNPNSRLAKKMRDEKNAARNQRLRNFAGNVAHISRNALILIVGTILTAVTTGVGLLSKAFTVISQIGGDIRKRAIDEATYNFEPGTLEAFEKFAAQRPDIDKDMLKQAAGGFHKAWSTPLNYTDGGFNQLAPYLREGTVKLVSMATADGDKNVFRSMGLVIDDLVDKSLKGIGGAKPFDPTTKEGRHAAHSANVSVLTEHNQGMGQLMAAYWNDFMLQKKTRIEDWKVNGRVMTFENWITQGAWNPEYATKTGIDVPTARTAADRTNQLLQQFLGTYRNLAHDVGIVFQAQISGLIEFLRNNLTNMIASYFPVFAQKENARAEQFIEQSQSFIESVLPGYEVEAQKHLRGAFYSGSLEEFEPIYEDIKRGRTTSIPSDMDRDALIKILPALANYYKALRYKREIEAEIAKGEANPDHVLKAVHVNSETLAAEAGFEATAMQRKMVAGAKNTTNENLPVGVRGDASAFMGQAAIVIKELPRLGASALKRASNAVHNKTLASKEEALARRLEHLAAWSDDGGNYPYSSKSNLQDVIKDTYRGLLGFYQRGGDKQAYKDTLAEFRDFLMGIEMTPEQYEEVLGREAEFKRRAANLGFFSEKHAEEFTRHGMKLTSIEEAFLVEERLRQIEADEAFAATHGSREAQANRQLETGGFMNATNLLADVKQQVKRQHGVDFDEWLADRLNTAHFDVADGVGKNESGNDIIINFIDDRGIKKTFQLQLNNVYGMVKDFYLKDSMSSIDMSQAFVAASRTEME